MAIAVIKAGGKQYVVTTGSKLEVEKIATEVGGSVAVDALLLASDDQASVEIGAPHVKTKVPLKVLEHYKGDKVSIVKFKNKVRYRRNVGHRQPYTKVEVGNF